MGWVYLGRSASGRAVAVKVVRPELADDQEFRTRFAREVAAARAVSGAFTAAVIDADTDGRLPWLATVYVPGPSLAEAVTRHGPFQESQVRRLGAGLVEALQVIHAAGLVHRDLKPSNVLLAEDGPRVIDFGISRFAGSSAITRPGVMIGTPAFMSPEQMTGGRPVRRAMCSHWAACWPLPPPATAPSEAVRVCCTGSSTRSPRWTRSRTGCAI